MSEQTIPVLAEHQAPELSTRPGGYTPNEHEKKALKLVHKLYEKAKRHRKKYDEHWLDYYKMFRGKQWKEQRPSYRHSEVVNFIFQAIQSMVPILTDARPKFDFLPQEPQDLEIAKILSEVSASDWERGNWLMHLTEMVYDAHFYGTGMGAMEFDPKARLGAGAITFESKDVFYCFPDPNAHDVNVRSRSFIFAEPVDIEILKREYPQHKEHIKPDVIDLMQGEKTDLDQVRYKSPVDNKTLMEGTSAYESAHKDQAIKITCYLLSDEFDEEKKETIGPDGLPQVTFEQKLKYPNGRKICVAGGVVLDDGPNPYECGEDDQKFPYARLVNYILPREFWGMSEVEQLSSPQKIFNKLVSFALDVLTLMGNPVWIVDDTSGVDTDNLFNRPGLVVEKARGSEVRREEGVQLQPYVLQMIDRMADWFQEISGRTDVTQGVSPGGVTAASAISQLQEAAQTRMRLKSRNLDACLQNLGQQYKNRAFQFYTAPRVFRLTANENSQKYFKFHIETTQHSDGTTQRKAVVRPYNQTPEGGYAESLEATEYIIRGDFDVKVSTGSSLPFAKDQRSNLAFKLAELGVFDEPALLEAVDYPNWQAIWSRVEERKKQKAMAEAQAAPPPAPPGNPAGPS
jgi:hypothetical protein